MIVPMSFTIDFQIATLFLSSALMSIRSSVARSSRTTSVTFFSLSRA
jgi:hypothetical protein